MTTLTLKTSVNKKDTLKQIKDNLYTGRRYVQLLCPKKNQSNVKYIRNSYKSERKWKKKIERAEQIRISQKKKQI